MPTTLAHAVAGYAAAEATSSTQDTSNSAWAVVLLAVFVANAPDLDFIPGLLADNIPKYHRTMSHGLPAAVGVASIGTLLLRGWWKGSWPRLWLLIFAAYTSHLLLDVFAPDPTDGDGLRLWWPLNRTWTAYPLPLLEPLNELRMLDHGPTNSTFWTTLFSGRAVAVFLLDGVLALPLVVLARFSRRLRLPLRQADDDAKIVDPEVASERRSRPNPHGKPNPS